MDKRTPNRDSLAWKFGYYVLGPAFIVLILGMIVCGVVAWVAR